MAYMRGKHYLWGDAHNNLHIWSADGYDQWDNSNWACNEDGVRHEGYENAGGVSIPMDVMDEYVMMRLAQLIYEGKAAGAIDRATADGNAGCMMLGKNADTIKRVLNPLKLEPQENP